MNLDKIVDQTFYWIDENARRSAMALSQKLSRRNFLSRLGMLITGAAAFPLLPVKRAFSQSAVQEVGDPQSCDYWRYCALSGFLCTCCGGGIHSCPPGAEPSPVSWVGTCINPDDGKAYLIAYRDCCGKPSCGQCGCDNTDRETQLYMPQLNNDVIWCFGTSSMEYHCSTAVLVGAAG